MRYTIQNINAWSAFKFGSVIGGVLGLFPGLTVGLTLRALIQGLLTWLESWLTLDIPVVGSYSLLDAVNLKDFVAQLQQWNSRGWLLVLLLLLSSMVVGGLVTGVLSSLGAAVYNLVATFSGGLVLRADTMDISVVSAEVPASMPATFPTSPMPSSNYPQAAVKQGEQLPNTSAAKPPSGEGAVGWLFSQATQQHFPIGRGETLIGSGFNNQIVLDGLATNHAAIRWENGRFVLYDFSEGQTWVNGRSLVGPNMSKAGFQIRLGNQELLFQE